MCLLTTKPEVNEFSNWVTSYPVCADKVSRVSDIHKPSGTVIV